MAKAERSIIINVPRSHLLDVITDFEKYPEFIPDMKHSRQLSRTGDVYEVKFTVQIIKRIDYTLRLTATPPTGLTWVLIDSNLMTVNDGGWRLEEVDEHSCRAHYFIALKVGRFVPKAITTKLAEVSLPKTLEQFKHRSESTYKK